MKRIQACLISFIVCLLINFSDPSLGGADDWVNINGTVAYNGTPVCAMVLANGQYMFTSDADGNFSMDVPLDDMGRVTLFSFCSGLPPHESFKPQITPGMLTFHKADENMISSLMNK